MINSMKKIILFIASATVMVLMTSHGQASETEEPVKVDILSWPRMTVNDFGCMMEQTFGHRDERFNCDLKSYENNGSPCYNTNEYYEGPLFPQHIVKKVHPRLEQISLSWEGGKLQHLWLIFEREFTEAEILNAFEIRPGKLPNNIYNLNLDGYHISLYGFDHFGAGEADCDEEMISEIFYGLPESIMPDYLKTKEQRIKAHREGQLKSDGFIQVERYSLSHQIFLNESNYDLWEMTVRYLEEGDSKVTITVQQTSVSDSLSLKSDKTLQYDFKSKNFSNGEIQISD